MRRALLDHSIERIARGAERYRRKSRFGVENQELRSRQRQRRRGMEHRFFWYLHSTSIPYDSPHTLCAGNYASRTILDRELPLAVSRRPACERTGILDPIPGSIN